MPSACFDCNQQSTHLKHAKGMSLRYDVVNLSDLTQPHAEMLPVFYKDSNFLPKPSLFPFYPKSVIRVCESYGLMTDLGLSEFRTKNAQNRGTRRRKIKKNDKKCTFFEKNADFFLQVSKIVVTLHSQFGNE